MKKFICMMMCVMILALMVGCAKSIEAETTETTVAAVETEPVTTEAPTTSPLESVEEFEKSLEDFNTDTMTIYTTWSDDYDTYFIWLSTPITWNYFYSQDNYDSICDGFDLICLEGEAASGVSTFFTMLDLNNEVIYASYNGTDWTAEAIAAFD